MADARAIGHLRIADRVDRRVVAVRASRSSKSSGSVAICELAAVVVRPLGAVAIAVDLDPVAVGIAEVERLAHQVVGGAVKLPAALGQAHERHRQVTAGRHQDREVEEPGLARVAGWRGAVADEREEGRQAGRPSQQN